MSICSCRPWIIPARAGFTQYGRGHQHRRRDHPRSRGVYVSRAVSGAVENGSSPLARGLRALEFGDSIEERIIPARAGFTKRNGIISTMILDHPRSRGVYCPATIGSTSIGGSSPLARGLPATSRTCGDRRRIIPARAGFTNPTDQSLAVARDHPRSRGVYIGLGQLALGAQGSSPLARGLPRNRSGTHTTGRIIPARAGFT